MTNPFLPRLDILPPPQRRLWDELAEVPAAFVLYGGTAIALHLGHRQSVDFDFFGNRPLDPTKLMLDLPTALASAVDLDDLPVVVGMSDAGESRP